MIMEPTGEKADGSPLISPEHLPQSSKISSRSHAYFMHKKKGKIRQDIRKVVLPTRAGYHDRGNPDEPKCWKAYTFAIFLLIDTLFLVSLNILSCGGKGLEEKALRQSAVETIRRFLDACGKGNAEEARDFFCPHYLEENQVPSPLRKEDLEAALGRLSSYRFITDELRVEGNMAVAPVHLRLEGEEGEREEFISLEWESSHWQITSFTALDWKRRATPKELALALAEAQSALRSFLADCIDHRTDRVFAALSASFREKYRLNKPWTREEFSGIFGTARSYFFDPALMTYEDGRVEVDVTIEFGSPGNLEEQTSRVRLVLEEGNWKVDSFPFFLL